MGNSHLSDRSCWARAMAEGSHEGRWARALPSQAQTVFTSHFLLSVSGSHRRLEESPQAVFGEVPPSPASLDTP